MIESEERFREVNPGVNPVIHKMSWYRNISEVQNGNLIIWFQIVLHEEPSYKFPLIVENEMRR